MNILSQPDIHAAKLRWLVSADLPAVLHIAEHCPSWQWTSEDFQECFRSLDTIGKVVEVEGRVIGFLIYQLDREHQEVAVKTLAVDPDWQRRGVGRVMLQSLNRKLTQGYERVSLLVPETHLPLQLFLRSVGFRALRVVRRAYGDEDGYLMQKTRAMED